MIFFVSGVREVPPGGIELHIGFLHALEHLSNFDFLLFSVIEVALRAVCC